MDISVVIPVYGCKEALHELHRRLTETLSGLVEDYEIILVDDRCPQDSWSVIASLCAKDEHVVGIRLSRNFGQMCAILAGLDHSIGDWVVVMDCDLQDRPEGIAELYAKAQEGFDVVFARRVDRKDSASTKFFSRLFYKVYNYFTEGDYDGSLANFSISRRIVIDNYCTMREQGRDYPTFIKWLGFEQTAIDLVGDTRFSGTSSYNFRKKVRLAEDLIIAHSNKALMLSVKVGFFVTILALIALVVIVIRYFVSTEPIEMGWTSLIASMWLLGGLILAAIGVAGVYIGRIFNETKLRPLYVISTVMNREPDDEPTGTHATPIRTCRERPVGEQRRQNAPAAGLRSANTTTPASQHETTAGGESPRLGHGEPTT